VVDALLCWISIIVCWAAVAHWPHWWLILPSAVVVGTRYYALHLIGHDGLHGRLFQRRGWNDLFNDVVILGAIGAITRINKRNHIDHHDHLATLEDPDRHRHGCFNKATRLAVVAFLAGFTSVLRSVSNVFRPNRIAGGSNQSASVDQAYRLRDLVILAGWQVSLVVGLTWWIAWWAYPALWLVPVYIFTVLGDNLRSFLEHSHPERDDLADRHRLITFLSNRVERIFLAPMNMNFHAIHHLWPSIPYYRLPMAAQEIRENSESAGLVWRGSYLAYLWRYWRALPLTDCTPPHTAPADT
jgi:fatty acid desaturase